MNQNDIHIIEKYLNNELSPGDKASFEHKLKTDTELNKSFGTYLEIEQFMQNDLKHQAEEKSLRENISRLNQEFILNNKEGKVIPFYRKNFMWIAAAAILLGIISVLIFFLEDRQDLNQLASTYTRNELIQISHAMGSSTDTLEQGISYFNNKQYDEAIRLFSLIEQGSPKYAEAIKNIGLAYLQKKQYSEALKSFDQLIEMEYLHNNPGKFFKALTLVQRDQDQDEKQARIILEEVIAENAYGYQIAKKWLEKS